jgi:exopolyphosphatase/guanosine-5'-triphosphate,3'-diphosphate pyrophosphatase
VPQDGGSSIRAAIDVGSNSIHLLVAAVDASSGTLTSVTDESVQLGLGDVVDREGRFPEPTLRTILDAIGRYAQRAEALGAGPPIVMGTEPLRLASNRSVVQAEILRTIGCPLLLLSHAAEAELTFLGVTSGRPPERPVAVVDVGGGSTEIVLAAPGRDPVVGSIAIGSARLTATFVANDPPTWFEINALRAEAERLAAGLPAPDTQLPLERCIGVGGSATNLVRLVEPGAALDRPALERAFSILARDTALAIAARYGVSVRRARQLPGGAALLDAILARYGVASLDVSTASLREGAVLASVRGGERWLERLPEMVR